MAKQEDITPRDPWQWQANPFVLVSRRERVVQFPRVLLDREATTAEMDKWTSRDCTARERNEATMTISMGVTFLAAWTSAWALRGIAGVSAAPKGAPAEGQCMLVTPPRAQTLVGRDFKDRESGRENPVVQHAAWRRVVAYLQARGRLLAEAGDYDMFTAEAGHDGPDVHAMPLLDVLQRRTPAGMLAEADILAAIPYCRESLQLGALHDHAARYQSAWNIVTTCRARAVAFGDKLI